MNDMTNITTATNAIQQATTVADKATLVRLKQQRFNCSKQDRSQTESVEISTNTHGKKVARVNKTLFKDSARMKAISEAYSQMYHYHKSMTLPWLDEGQRLLPNSRYIEYKQQMNVHEQACSDAVSEFLAHYSQEVRDDALSLGNVLYDSNDYPDYYDMSCKFNIDLQFLPVPHSGDFRTEVDQDTIDSLNRALHDAQNGVHKDMVRQLLEPLQTMVDKLRTPIGEKGAVFRNTLYTNLQELTATFKASNMVEDAQVSAFIKACEALGNETEWKADALRNDNNARSAQADKAQEVLDNFAGLSF